MALPVPAAPALPFDKIYEGICSNCLSVCHARHLRQDEEFARLRWRSHQIFYIHFWAQNTLGIQISHGSLQRAFKCSQSTVRAALQNGFDEPKQRGRHLAVDAESEADILAHIQRNYEKNMPTTRTDIRNYCSLKFNKKMTKGWVDSFIGRHLTELIETTSTPQEEPRLQVPRIFLDETIQAMKEAVHLRPADLVFNLDEVGISDWEDRKSKRVVVPITAEGQTVHHGVSRSLKHLSIVTCISAGGQCLTPYMVTSQASQPVRHRLSATGLQIGTHLILQQRNKPYINSELFVDYIRRVFLPYLSNLRRRPELADEEAVLLMDNCPAHVTQEVLDLLTEARVRVVTFAPHTTNIFQALDLTLFGVLKRHGQYQLPFNNENRTADFIFKTYKDFRLTMIDTNIWGAFRGIGLSFHDIDDVRRVLFDEITLRESRGFKELWMIDYPPDKLSLRRRNAKFGWINKQD